MLIGIIVALIRKLDSRIEKNERDDGFKSKQKSPSSSSVLGQMHLIGRCRLSRS